jgi:hypothetical protein
MKSVLLRKILVNLHTGHVFQNRGSPTGTDICHVCHLLPSLLNNARALYRVGSPNSGQYLEHEQTDTSKPATAKRAMHTGRDSEVPEGQGEGSVHDTNKPVRSSA